MGRIKTILVKRTAKKLFKKFDNEFSEDFNKNKENIRKHTNIDSNKIVNRVSGYLTRLVKQSKEDKLPNKIKAD